MCVAVQLDKLHRQRRHRYHGIFRCAGIEPAGGRDGYGLLRQSTGWGGVQAVRVDGSRVGVNGPVHGLIERRHGSGELLRLAWRQRYRWGIYSQSYWRVLPGSAELRNEDVRIPTGDGSGCRTGEVHRLAIAGHGKTAGNHGHGGRPIVARSAQIAAEQE